MPQLEFPGRFTNPLALGIIKTGKFVKISGNIVVESTVRQANRPVVCTATGNRNDSRRDGNDFDGVESFQNILPTPVVQKAMPDRFNSLTGDSAINDLTLAYPVVATIATPAAMLGISHIQGIE